MIQYFSDKAIPRISNTRFLFRLDKPPQSQRSINQPLMFNVTLLISINVYLFDYQYE